MQRKTIAKAIKSKMESWLSSITDEKLRKDVKKELLVSGGSITSMFMNEPVNDFDVYIKTPETCYRLAKYYTQAFPELNVFKGKDREKHLSDYANKGGDGKDVNIYKVFLENLKEDQVKIMILGEAGYKTSFEDEGTEKYVPVYFSPNAVSLSDKVQIVLRFTGDNKQIHESFDFVHATNYFTFEDGLVTNIESLESILSKQLKYQGSKYPLTSIIRTKKFLKRGWNIGAGEYLKIMFQISELDLTDFNTLEEQLIGVDVSFFSKLIEILRNKQESDPTFTLTHEYLGALIDKVFNEA